MKDNFSTQANLYARYRPDYSQEIYDFIFQYVGEFNNAWDCATGNGQIAGKLATYFKNVYATDISQKQIDNAVQLPNIQYAISSAEQTPFSDNTFDLVTVGQALHWFKFDEFYNEVVRITKNKGVLAVWGYGLNNTEPEIDKILRDFDEAELRPHWDPERNHIDTAYESIPFPFKKVFKAEFSVPKQWTLADYEGYLNSWSVVQKLIKSTGVNPVDNIIKKVSVYWAADEIKTVRFPVFLKLAVIEK